MRVPTFKPQVVANNEYWQTDHIETLLEQTYYVWLSLPDGFRVSKDIICYKNKNKCRIHYIAIGGVNFNYWPQSVAVAYSYLPRTPSIKLNYSVNFTKNKPVLSQNSFSQKIVAICATTNKAKKVKMSNKHCPVTVLMEKLSIFNTRHKNLSVSPAPRIVPQVLTQNYFAPQQTVVVPPAAPASGGAVFIPRLHAIAEAKPAALPDCPVPSLAG